MKEYVVILEKWVSQGVMLMNPGCFEERYLDLFFRWQRYQWENYASDGSWDLNEVDAQLFSLFDSTRDMPRPAGRRGEVLGHIIDRGLVDQHPEVARLRNRIDTMHPRSAAVDRGQLRTTVLRLMHLRDGLAQERGHPSYVDLVLGIQDFDRDEIRALVEGYLHGNLDEAVGLIARHELTWEDWFSGLREIGEVPVNPEDLVDRLLRALGYEAEIQRPGVLMKEQPISGYVGVLSVPDDVRILVRPVRSLQGAMTLLHESGHALAHRFNRAEGIFKTWTSLHDEVMAVLVERIGIHVLMGARCRETAATLSLLEGVRVATSFLFELDLWAYPSEAEDLYMRHYGRLGLKIPDPGIWVADTFRSLDPVYIHSYLAGEMVAEKAVPHLVHQFGEDLPMWGSWLRENCFADGRRRSLREKVAPLMPW